MKYKNIILDFDSTLVKIEGIDELGKIKNLENKISEMTNQAMNGQSKIEDIFIKRLKLIQPQLTDLENLGRLYIQNLNPGVKDFIHTMKNKYKIFVISGGYLSSILPTTRLLGLDDQNVFANKILFNEAGFYLSLDKETPLWKKEGKKIILTKIINKHPGKTIVIGDGYSDLEMSKLSDLFICYAGNVYRENIAKKANITIKENNFLKVAESILDYESYN